MYLKNTTNPENWGERIPDERIDWTYDELIAALTTDHDNEYLAKYKTQVERGMLFRIPITLTVEQRVIMVPASHGESDETEMQLTDHRFWCFDEEGTKEISATEYKEIREEFDADERLRRAYRFGIFRFRIEDNLRYLHLATWTAEPSRHFSITWNRVTRHSDGRLGWEYLDTLAIS